MKLVALMPVRNEDWVLGLSARVALKWCDALVLLNHASTDRTAEIIRELTEESGERVRCLDVHDGKWDEMAHRQQLLDYARAMAATHIALVDADEVLTGNLVDSIRWHIEAAPARGLCRLPLYNLRGGIERYHATGVWAERAVSVAFVDDPQLHWSGDRFHHREPMGLQLKHICPVQHAAGGVMHLWGASERRIRAKHALYKMTEVLRWPEKNRTEVDHVYSQAIRDTGWRYDEVPECWWAPYRDLLQHLHVEGEPWQEAECRRLYAEHGADRFGGLDLFGVVN